MKNIIELTQKKNSRTTNSILNFITGIGGQLFNIVLQFAVRTVFIQTLGKSYLGVNGVFSNILSMLSLAELGVGSAILYKLYDPISKKDHQRILNLLHFYRTVYRFIGLVVAILGCILIPFLPYLAKDYDKLSQLNINAVFVFLLYLLRSVSSYFFFAYKRGIIKADQKEYLINIIKFGGSVISSILQIVLLKTVCNFNLYVTVLIITVIGENIIVGVLADKMYPYIKKDKAQGLPREEKKGIFKDCGALLIYRLNRVVLKATDNLVLSSYMGFDYVGLYSNYYILYSTIDNMFTRLFGSITHSLGNLHVTTNKTHEYEVFRIVNLLTAIIGGTAGVGIFIVADEFVEVWIGKEWVIVQPFSLLMGIEIYTLAIRQEFTRYRTSMGLFQQGKYRPLAGMIINLVVSILLVKEWGICGVLVGTIASDWLTLIWYEPILTHKHGFRDVSLLKGYFYRFIYYSIVVVICGVIDYLICRHVFSGHGWFSVAVHAIICGASVPLAFILITYKTKEGQYVIKLLTQQYHRIIKRLKK